MRSLKPLALSALLLLPGLSAAFAGDGPEFWNCEELWQNRNQIYKDAGYCFRTARAIRAFGNAGCQYDNLNFVPLSPVQRREIADIQRYENRRNCPR
jgi:YARHG domain